MESFRRRINISQSVKGVITFDMTVESEHATRKELLREHCQLVRILKKLYPVEEK